MHLTEANVHTLGYLCRGEIDEAVVGFELGGGRSCCLLPEETVGRPARLLHRVQCLFPKSFCLLFLPRISLMETPAPRLHGS